MDYESDETWYIFYFVFMKDYKLSLNYQKRKYQSQHCKMSHNFLPTSTAFNWVVLSILKYVFKVQNGSDYDDGLSKYVQNVLAPFFHIFYEVNTLTFFL